MIEQNKEIDLDEILLSKHEKLLHYNGTEEIIYRDDLHAYYHVQDGKAYLVHGVTNVLDIIDKPALVQWAANQTIEYIKEKSPYRKFKSGDTVYTFITQEELEALLNQARFNYRNTSKIALDIGKIAHSWLEVYIKCIIENVEKPTTLPDNEKSINCINAFLDWAKKHSFKPISSERKVFSKEFSYCGTYDCDAYITSCGDEKCCPFTGTILVLVDFKSSKAIYDEYKIQTAAYLKAKQEEFPNEDEYTRVILRLGKEDGEFEAAILPVEENENDFQAFVGALTVYNWKKQMQYNKKFEKLVAKEEAKKAKLASKKVKTPKKVEVKV